MKKTKFSLFAVAALALAAIFRLGFPKTDGEAHCPENGTGFDSSAERLEAGETNEQGIGPDVSATKQSDFVTVAEPNGNKSASTLLTEEEALEIAKRELGDYGYDHDAPIKVERGEDFFVFEFPEPPHGEPGEWHGADFAARVRVNAKTGKVDDILVGG